MSDFKKAFVISTVLHLLPFLLLFSLSSSSNSKQPPKSNGNSAKKEEARKVIPKPSNEEITISLVEKKQKNSELQKKQKKNKNTCKDFYGGIGIAISFVSARSYQVVEVYEGYPADQSGVERGDILTPVNNNEDIDGVPGTEVALLVERGSDTFILRIKRAKICYDKIPYGNNNYKPRTKLESKTEPVSLIVHRL